MRLEFLDPGLKVHQVMIDRFELFKRSVDFK